MHQDTTKFVHISKPCLKFPIVSGYFYLSYLLEENLLKTRIVICMLLVCSKALISAWDSGMSVQDFSEVYPLLCVYTQARLLLPMHTEYRVENCHSLRILCPEQKATHISYKLQRKRLHENVQEA